MEIESFTLPDVEGGLPTSSKHKAILVQVTMIKVYKKFDGKRFTCVSVVFNFSRAEYDSVHLPSGTKSRGINFPLDRVHSRQYWELMSACGLSCTDLAP